jgi:hypothetical protein
LDRLTNGAFERPDVIRWRLIYLAQALREIFAKQTLSSELRAHGLLQTRGTTAPPCSSVGHNRKITRRFPTRLLWVQFDIDGEILAFTADGIDAFRETIKTRSPRLMSSERTAVLTACIPSLSRDNLDENGGGNQGLKRRPVAKS